MNIDMDKWVILNERTITCSKHDMSILATTWPNDMNHYLNHDIFQTEKTILNKYFNL